MTRSFFKSYFSRIKIAFVDLDNTLYDDEVYLKECFKSISRLDVVRDLKSEELYEFLLQTYKQQGARHLYDKACKQYNLKLDLLLPHFLKVHRDVKLENLLQPYPWMAEFINEFLLAAKVVIVTNGTLEQQKNKVTQFDFSSINHEVTVIYANETKPKPSVESVNGYFLLHGRPEPTQMLFIGDHICDMLFAENLGIRFYHKDIIEQIQALDN